MRAVFEAYEPLVRAIAVRGFDGFAGFVSPCDRDDAVAATFVNAFSPATRQSYKPPTPYYSFLGGIARNTMRGMLRKAGREVPVPTGDPGTDLQAPDLWNPEAATSQCQQSELTCRFLEHLADPLLQSVALQTMAEGLSEQAAADRLGITRHQLRKCLETIRTRTRSFLKKEGLA